MEKNLYLITGDDLFERSREVEKIKKDFGELVKGINFIMIDKDTIGLLNGEVTTYPFGFDKKLIIVNIVSTKSSTSDEDGNSKNDWFTDELAENILNSMDMNILVFVGDFQARSRLYKFVNQNGKCIDCSKPKNKRDVAPWVMELVKQTGKNISMQDANYMVQICGADKLLLYNEVQKLIDYIGERIDIKKEDIESVGIRTLETIIFDLTDCLGTRNISNVLKYLEELLEQKEPLQKILIMIARHFKSLLITKFCIQENRNVSEELNTKFPFIINKYKEQSKKFTIDELKKILVDLAELDVDSKIGKIDLKIGLELCLVKAM